MELEFILLPEWLKRRKIKTERRCQSWYCQLQEFLIVIRDIIKIPEFNFSHFNSHEETLVQLVKDYPSDAELGQAVRKLYNRV